MEPMATTNDAFNKHVDSHQGFIEHVKHVCGQLFQYGGELHTIQMPDGKILNINMPAPNEIIGASVETRPNETRHIKIETAYNAFGVSIEPFFMNEDELSKFVHFVKEQYDVAMDAKLKRIAEMNAEDRLKTLQLAYGKLLDAVESYGKRLSTHHLNIDTLEAYKDAVRNSRRSDHIFFTASLGRYSIDFSVGRHEDEDYDMIITYFGPKENTVSYGRLGVYMDYKTNEADLVRYLDAIEQKMKVIMRENIRQEIRDYGNVSV